MRSSLAGASSVRSSCVGRRIRSARRRRCALAARARGPRADGDRRDISLGRADDAIAAGARAHVQAVRIGDVGLALRSSFGLGMTLIQRGEMAQGSGWLARGTRLVDETGYDGPECGRHTVSCAIKVTDSKRAMLGWPVVEFVFGHVLTLRTPMGRRMRGEIRKGGGPLLRVRLRDLDRAGVERHDAKTVGASDGRAGPRRRHGARRRQRRLGHRLPSRLLVHRGAGRRRRWLADRGDVASAQRCPACTSSASRSSTPSARCSWPEPAAMPGTSSIASPTV